VSVLAVAVVRQRVAALVEAVGSPFAAHESRWDLVSGVEPGQFAHGAFAVAVGSTAFESEIESSRRTRGTGGGMVRTALAIRWLWFLRAEAYVADYDLALAGEAAIVKALAAHVSANLRVSILSMTREVVGDGLWLRGEIVLRTDHTLALS
jgi:hypothetical protein